MHEAFSVLGLIHVVRSPLIRRCRYSRPADRSRYDHGTLLEPSVRSNRFGQPLRDLFLVPRGFAVFVNFTFGAGGPY